MTCILPFILKKIVFIISIHIIVNTLKNKKYMKKTLLKLFCISSIIIGNTFSSNAQVVTEGSKHVYLGLGFPNFPGVIYSLFGAGGGSSVGPFVATFKYAVKDKLAIGGTVNYSSASTGNFTNLNGGNYSYKFTLITAMANGSYHYSNSDKADFYSGFSLGYGFASFTTEGTPDLGESGPASVGGVAWQITPIGFRYLFTENIGAYTELGYGLNGLAQIGLSAKF